MFGTCVRTRRLGNSLARGLGSAQELAGDYEQNMLERTNTVDRAHGLCGLNDKWGPEVKPTHRKHLSSRKVEEGNNL